ncbi:MAG: phage minor head protein [Opitutae bacterium]
MKDFLKMKSNAKTAIIKEYSKEELESYHEKKISFTEKIESDYVLVIQAYFKQVQDKIEGSLKSYRKKAAKYNLDDEEEAKIMAEISVPFIQDTILKESALAYAFVGIPDQRLDDQDKIVRRFLKEEVLRLGKSTSETTRNDVTDIIKKWNEDGGDIAQLRGMLGEYFGDPSRAAGFAQETVYEEVGAVSKKWITAIDERVCQFCSEMDGQTTGISDNYWDKGEEMAGSEGGTLSFDFDNVSTPPLHPSCRCDLIPIFNEAKSMPAFKKHNQKRLEESKKAFDNMKASEKIEKAKKELEEKESAISKKELEIEELKKSLEQQTKKEIKKYEELKEKLEVKIKEVEDLKDSI